LNLNFGMFLLTMPKACAMHSTLYQKTLILRNSPGFRGCSVLSLMSGRRFAFFRVNLKGD
jgi:hypothetical protein